VVELNELRGSCHCGRLSLCFSTSLSLKDYNPRACDCSYCKKHAAMYVSDPSGRLLIDVNGIDGLGRYRQGSETADFLYCVDCGVLIGVVFESDGDIYGAVNVRCLEGYENLGEPKIVSPRKLSPEEKKVRWNAVWTKGVNIRASDV
jgi:hypothetical protein